MITVTRPINFCGNRISSWAWTPATETGWMMKQMWGGEGPYPHGYLMNQLDPVATDFALASNLDGQAWTGADWGLTLEEALVTVSLG